MPFGEKIKQLRISKNLTQADVAKLLDPAYTAQAVHKWEANGNIPKMGVLKQLGDIFGVSVSELLDEEEFGYPVKPSAATIPVMRMGYVHAGDPEEGIEDIYDVEAPADVVAHHKQARFLEVKGDCMDLAYPEGCMVLVDPAMTPRNGCCVVADLGQGEYVMRRYHRFRDTLVLSSESHAGDYPDIVISDPEQEVSVWGVICWFQAKEDER